jgi:hypothetical protein
MADASKWRQYTPRADPGPMPDVFARPVPIQEQPVAAEARELTLTSKILKYGLDAVMSNVPLIEKALGLPPEQPMNESEFDPRAALGRLAGAAPTEPPAAGGATDPPPPAPTHAETRERRRSAALELVARYRAAYPGDPRTDDQLLVAPYGGYEMLATAPLDVLDVCKERLASLRPKPAEEAEP